MYLCIGLEWTVSHHRCVLGAAIGCVACCRGVQWLKQLLGVLWLSRLARSGRTQSVSSPGYPIVLGAMAVYGRGLTRISLLWAVAVAVIRVELPG